MKKLLYPISLVLILSLGSCQGNEVFTIKSGVTTVNRICTKIITVKDKIKCNTGNATDDNASTVDNGAGSLLPANVWNTKLLF